MTTKHTSECNHEYYPAIEPWPPECKHCGLLKSTIEQHTPTVDGAGIDTLVRDLTKVHPQPKSYVRRVLTDYLSRLHSYIVEEVEQADLLDLSLKGIHIISYAKAKKKDIEIINQAFKDL